MMLYGARHGFEVDFGDLDRSQVAGTTATGAPGETIVVADAHLLFNADFKKVGHDLVLIGEDGRKFVVYDYFSGERRPTLATKDGATLTPGVIEALAGPDMPGHYAQAGAVAAATTPIGRVEKASGITTVVRNGVSITLNVGDPVLKGDVVQTGRDSSLGISFIDGTAFSLSSSARMVLNEMVYDPNSTANVALLSLVEGTISFVAGKVAKSGDMRVETPVATMGIRGTAVLVSIQSTDGKTSVKHSVLVEPDGTTGSFNVYDKGTGTLIGTVNQAGTWFSVASTGFHEFSAKSQEDLRVEQQVVQQAFAVAAIAQQFVADVQKAAESQKTDGGTKTEAGGGTGSGTSTIIVNGTENTGSNTQTTPQKETPAPDKPVAEQQSTTTVVKADQTGPVQIEVIETKAAPPNAAPTVSALAVALVDGASSDAGRVLSGSLLAGASDADGDGLSVTSAGVRHGTYGDLSFDGSGYVYTANASVDSLKRGESATDVFTYSITDGQGHSVSNTLTVQVTGENDRPVALDDATTVRGGQVVAAGLRDAGVLGNDRDADHDETQALKVVSVASVDGDDHGAVAMQTTGITLEGKYGHLTLYANGAYSYVADKSDSLGPAETGEDHFTYTIDDGSLTATSTATATLTIAVTGEDGVHSPTLTLAPSEAAYQDTTAPDTFAAVTGQASGSDVDDGDLSSGIYGIAGGTAASHAAGGLSYDVQKASAYGTLYLNATSGAYRFEPNAAAIEGLSAGQNPDVAFTLTFSDGQHTPQDQASQVLTVHLSGANDAAVLSLRSGAAYMTGASDPWGVAPSNAGSPDAAMDTAFGAANWTKYQGFTTAAFSAGYGFVYLDGGDGTSSEFNAFVGAHRAEIESFVSQGGHLFINAARYDGGDLGLGFGATLRYGGAATYSTNGYAVDPAHPVFNGPNGSAGASWSGNYFGHDIVLGNGLTPLITSGAGGTGNVLLAFESYGAGFVVVGGMTSPFFHSPQPYADILRANILDFAAGADGGGGGSLTYTDTAAADSFAAASGQFTASDADAGGLAGAVFGISGGSAASHAVGNDVFDVQKVSAYGTLYLKSSTGQYRFEPDAAAINGLGSGDHSITFDVTLTETDGSSASKTMVVTLHGANDAPVAAADSVTATEDTPVTTGNVLANDSDADNTLTGASISSFGQGSHGGVVSNGDGTFTYAPNANFSGTDSFTYTISDGALSSTATVSVTVAPANDAPVVAASQSRTIAEDGSTGAVAIGATDADGDTLTYSVKSGAGPSFGSVNFGSGTFTYAPNANANGTDHFTILVSDGTATSEQAVTVTVTPVNDAPVVAASQSRTIAEDGSTGAVAIGATDVDGDTLTYSVKSGFGPSFGSVNFGPGTFSYAPNANANGTDHFTILVSDGTETREQAVTVTVSAVNDAPVVAASQLRTIAEDGSTGAVAIGATDADGDTLTYSVKSGAGPSFGSVNFGSGTFTYAPNANANGTDHFTILVSDGTATREQAVTVTVNPVNDAPTLSQATNAISYTENGAPVRLLPSVAFGDPDLPADFSGAMLAVGVTGGVAADRVGLVAVGGVSLDGLHVNHDGMRVADVTMGAIGSNAYTLTFNADANAADVQAVIQALAFDSGSDNPSGASRTALITFNDSGHTGPGQLSVNASVTIAVAPVNDAPTNAPVVLAAIAEDSGAHLISQPDLLAHAGDVDGPSPVRALDLQIASGSGSLVDNDNGTWSYTPAANDSSSVTFSYRVTDGSLETAGSATLDITPVNGAADLGGDISKQVVEGDTAAALSTSGQLTISDVAGEESFQPLANVAGDYGTFSINQSGTWSYVADGAHDEFADGVTYSDVFTVHSADGTEQSVTVEILGTDDFPALGGGGYVDYTEGAQAVAIAPGLTISDIDGGSSITGATVRIDGYESGEDVLAFTDQNGISGSFNSYSGVLSLTGSADLDAYQDALRSVKFYYGSGAAQGAEDRTIVFTVDDGTTSSNSVSVTVTVAPTDEPPHLVESRSDTMGGNQLGEPVSTKTFAIPDGFSLDTTGWTALTPAGGAADPDANGHSYVYVPANLTWSEAKALAESLGGYLATITSATENGLVQDSMGHSHAAFFGATDAPGSGQTDAQTEGHWRWADGPEQGTEFWRGTWNTQQTDCGSYVYVLDPADGGEVAGAYQNWATHEPNNLNNGNEDVAEIFGNEGTWNDIEDVRSLRQGFVIEFDADHPAPTLYQQANTYGSAILAVGAGSATIALVLDNTLPATDALIGGSTTLVDIAVSLVDAGNTTVSVEAHFTIEGRNDQLVLSGNQGTIIEGSGQFGYPNSINGHVSYGDADRAIALDPTADGGVQTDHGWFFINENGDWTYVLDDSDPAVQALPQSSEQVPHTLSDQATLYEADGVTVAGQVYVTIEGSNDAPVVDLAADDPGSLDRVTSTAYGDNVLGDTIALFDVDAGATIESITVTLEYGFAGDVLVAVGSEQVSVTGMEGAVLLTNLGGGSVEDFRSVLTSISLVNHGGLGDGERGISVTVFDGTENGTPAWSRVTIDSNLLPDTIAPDVTLASGSATISENADTAGGVQFTDITIGDEDGTYTLALDGADSGSFEIRGTGDQLELWFTGSLSYDAQTSYAVSVVASDAGGSSQADFTLFVEQNQAPIIVDPLGGSVQEDGTLSAKGQLAANDSDDNPAPRWDFAENGTDYAGATYRFAIDDFQVSRNGAVILHDAFDGAAPPSTPVENAFYRTFGGFVSENGKAILGGNLGDQTVSAVGAVPQIGQKATYNSNVDPSAPGRGLSVGSDFEIDARFDLDAPGSGESYGIRLDDSTFDTTAEDRLDLRLVRRDGHTVVELRSVNESAGTAASIGSSASLDDLGGSQIELRFVHSAAASGAPVDKSVAGQYRILDNGGQAIVLTNGAVTISDAQGWASLGSGTLFSDESFTRAAFAAFGSPVDDDSVHIAKATSDYGTMFLDRDTGLWTYSLNNRGAATQYLAAGDAQDDAFSVVATDAHGAISEAKTVTVEIAGEDEAPRLLAQIPDAIFRSSAGTHLYLASYFASSNSNEALTYSATLSNGAALPSWLQFNTATGELTVQAGASGTGSVEIAVTANQGGHTVYDTFALDRAPHFDSMTSVSAGSLSEDQARIGAGIYSIAGHLDARDDDLGPALTWTVRQGDNVVLDVEAASYAFKIDQFKITKTVSGSPTIFFQDAFDDGAAPPSRAGATGSSTALYDVSAAPSGLTEQGGYVLLTSDAATASSAVLSNNDPNIREHVTLQTNRDPDGTTGLRKTDTFTVEGRFAYLAPENIQDAYGIRLTDAHGAGPNGLAASDGDDVVDLLVRRDYDGVVRVDLVEKNFVTGESKTLQAFALPDAAEGDSIVLRLSHATTDASRPGKITATYDVIHDGVATTHSFTASADIFGYGLGAGQDGKTVETWTRAEFHATANARTSDFIHGEYGTLALDQAGNWHYALDNTLDATQALSQGEIKHDIFNVTVTDSDGHVGQRDIDITVTGVNDGPSAHDDYVIFSGIAPHALSDEALLFNDTDRDGDASLHVASNGFGSASGVGTYQYTVEDNHQASSAATITVMEVTDQDPREIKNLSGHDAILVAQAGSNDKLVGSEDDTDIFVIPQAPEGNAGMIHIAGFGAEDDVIDLPYLRNNVTLINNGNIGDFVRVHADEGGPMTLQYNAAGDATGTSTAWVTQAVFDQPVADPHLTIIWANHQASVATGFVMPTHQT